MKPNPEQDAKEFLIPPDLAQMVDDIRVAKEALEMCEVFREGTQSQKDAMVLREQALTRLKPYEKLFEKEGGE